MPEYKRKEEQPEGRPQPDSEVKAKIDALAGMDLGDTPLDQVQEVVDMVFPNDPEKGKSIMEVFARLQGAAKRTDIACPQHLELVDKIVGSDVIDKIAIEAAQAIEALVGLGMAVKGMDEVMLNDMDLPPGLRQMHNKILNREKDGIYSKHDICDIVHGFGLAINARVISKLLEWAGLDEDDYGVLMADHVREGLELATMHLQHKTFISQHLNMVGAEMIPRVSTTIFKQIVEDHDLPTAMKTIRSMKLPLSPDDIK